MDDRADWADWAALARGLDGPLVRPGDADYATARLLYNTRFDDLRPAAVAYVTGDDDVRTCLAFARRHRTPVALRSGGHSYTGWSSGTGPLVIDVSGIDHVRPDGTTAATGAGARLVHVYRTLARHGRAIPAGTCPTVGISGLTLGGGHGVTSRAYGLTCDSLTGATVVTADGRLLTADAEEHPDLFWALRGAGAGTLGVVTELRFRTHPVPATVVSGRLTWPWARARSVLAAWQAWGPAQPDEIWSALRLAADPGAEPALTLSVCTVGDRTELENALDRLADHTGAPADSVHLHDRTYLEAMLTYAECAGLTEAQCHLPGTTPGSDPRGVLRRNTYTAVSDFFDRELSPAAVAALTAAPEAFARIPAAEGGGTGALQLTAFGGATGRVDPLATAFVHRRQRILVQYWASWRPGTPGAAQRAWLATARDSLGPYVSGSAYQNYPDPALKDWRTAYYGAAADRLSEVKRRYDPQRLFTFPQAF
ncbi:FAD-binding oxidoreductase [Streptomyces sp. NPDC045431]|uniref:FAD-binding oxidoreductase n=1 Tax=Streptomyces sp. NPDC045431 TaxID=3155613 RepID=UPI0033C9A7EA